MLTCKDIAENASEFISEDAGLKVSFKLKMELMFHKMMCGHCRRFLYYFETLYRNPGILPRTDISDSEVDKIIQQIKKAKK